MVYFNQKSAAKITGLTVKQLQYWDESGLIVPSHMEQTEWGINRLYTFADMLKLKVVKRLREQGVSLQKIRKSLEYVSRFAENPLTEVTLLSDGHSIYTRTRDKSIVEDTLMGGQLAWSIGLGDVAREVGQETRKLVRRRQATLEVDGRKIPAHVQADLEHGGYLAGCAFLPGYTGRGETEEDALQDLKASLQDLLTMDFGAVQQ